MKLGLLADIHEYNQHLRTALSQFETEGVDQVVVLGDVFLMGDELDELDAEAVGVWGNHDFGLSSNPGHRAKQRFPRHVIEFMTSLGPRLEIDGCLFTHVEPWLNPEDILDLWYFEGPPDTAEKAARSFQAVPHRLMFMGHLHRWLLVTLAGPSEWDGEDSIKLDRKTRYLISVGAVCDGKYAVFDTETLELIPFHDPTASKLDAPSTL